MPNPGSLSVHQDGQRAIGSELNPWRPESVLGCVILNRLACKHPPLGRLDRLMFQDLDLLYTIGLPGSFLGHGRVKVLASSKNIYFPEPFAFRAVRRSRFRKICF
jgi:hypothetical protein